MTSSLLNTYKHGGYCHITLHGMRSSQVTGHLDIECHAVTVLMTTVVGASTLTHTHSEDCGHLLFIGVVLAVVDHQSAMQTAE